MRTPVKCNGVTLPSFTSTLMEWASLVAFMRYDLIRASAAKQNGQETQRRLFLEGAQKYGRLARNEWKHAKKEACHV